MPVRELKRLASKRRGGGGTGRLLRRLLAALLVVVLLIAGTAWFTGRLIMGQLAETLRLNPSAEIQADLVVALPLINLAYGRNLVIELQDQHPPVRISLKSFCGRIKKENGRRVWSVDLDRIRFERGSGALAAARMSADGSYDRTDGRVQLADGRVEYLLLSAGRTAMTSFTRLSFKRLSCDIRAGLLALGRSEDGFNPLDLLWRIEEARLENFKIGLSFLDGYETTAMNVNLSGFNSPERWSLVLDMNTSREAADDLGDGQRRSLTGFLNKAVGQTLDAAKLLRFDHLSLDCGGGWAEADGSPEHTRLEGTFLFPRLFTMTINGSGRPATRDEAADWLGGCFKSRDDGDPAPRCLSALGFDSFGVNYGDRGLSFITRPIKTFRDKIFGEIDPAGPLGLPALGLALGLWLDERQPGVPAGAFAFMAPPEAGDGPLYPFRSDFFSALRDGTTVEVLFSAP